MFWVPAGWMSSSFVSVFMKDQTHTVIGSLHVLVGWLVVKGQIPHEWYVFYCSPCSAGLYLSIFGLFSLCLLVFHLVGSIDFCRVLSL